MQIDWYRSSTEHNEMLTVCIIGWPDYIAWNSSGYWRNYSCSLPLEIGCSPCSKTKQMNRPVCLEAHNYTLAHLSLYFFCIFATSNIDLVASILHKIYLMQRILIHIKSQFLCWIWQPARTWWPIANTTIVARSYCRDVNSFTPGTFEWSYVWENIKFILVIGVIRWSSLDLTGAGNGLILSGTDSTSSMSPNMASLGHNPGHNGLKAKSHLYVGRRYML